MKNETYTGWVRDPRDPSIGDMLFNPVINEWISITRMVFVHHRDPSLRSRHQRAHNFMANGFLLDKK